ncbi:MAG: 3-deoxy-8-phosphooctulonate synthase, partial [Bacteroidales bacterium]|nr:3-deoxy-8-phosphooctulonate synthase [Bacteroidales bacterium]
MYPKLDKLRYTETGNFFVIAGPCVVEDTESPLRIAEHLVQIADKYQIPFAFKASYRKANRSSLHSFSGIGDQEGLEVLRRIKERFDVPIVTDIHAEEEAAQAAEVADV